MQEMYQKYFIDVLRNEYAEFNGRKNRNDYWMYVLCFALISIALNVLVSIFKGVFLLGFIFNALSWLYMVALLVPSLGMSIRRLHDTGKDWPWILLAVIPVFGWIPLIIFLVQEGQKTDNQFGPYVG